MTFALSFRRPLIWVLTASGWLVAGALYQTYRSPPRDRGEGSRNSIRQAQTPLAPEKGFAEGDTLSSSPKATPPSGARASGFSADEEVLDRWLQKVEVLRKSVLKMPQYGIPEMKFLRSEDWLIAANDADVTTEFGVRKALGNLRMAAKNRTALIMVDAMRQFKSANPAGSLVNATQLDAYSSIPLTAELLSRYDVLPAGTAPKDGIVPSVVEKSEIDPWFDSKMVIGLNGSFSLTTTHNAGGIVGEAMEQYKRANNNRPPTSAGELVPLLNVPVSPEIVQDIIYASRPERTN